MADTIEEKLDIIGDDVSNLKDNIVPMVLRHDKILLGDEDDKLGPRGRGVVDDVRDYRKFMKGMSKILWAIAGELALLILGAFLFAIAYFSKFGA